MEEPASMFSYLFVFFSDLKWVGFFWVFFRCFYEVQTLFIYVSYQPGDNVLGSDSPLKQYLYQKFISASNWQRVNNGSFDESESRPI